jgi:hypothetical protein
MTPLSFTHLHLLARAETDIYLGRHYAGNDLRNAWTNVIRHSTCPETHRREAPTPEHVAACPACWFVSAENQPGSVVRPYAFVPPQPLRDLVPAGETFAFGLTLFGEAWRFLPYAVLAAAEIGHIGVGRGRRDGLGRFRLEAIRSRNPFTGQERQLLAPGDPLVRVDPAPVTFADVLPHAESLAEQLRAAGNTLRLRFLSPTRLEENKHLFKSPDFAVLFRRLLYRIDDLARQYAGGGRRDPADKARLDRAADRVRLVESGARWLELSSWSGRKECNTPFSGFVGTAVYHAADWEPLLPWLLLGQGTQVGKSVVKGNGVYEIAGLEAGYWAEEPNSSKASIVR